jgi:hypothetical protein
MRTYALSDVAGKADAPAFLSISRQRSFFQLPEWFALVENCWAGSGYGAMLLAADDGRLAIACGRRRHDHALRSCTNLYTTEFELLGDSSNVEMARAFGRDMTSSFDGLQSLQLEGFDPAVSSFRALLEGIRSSGWVAKPYFGWAVWRERVAGTGFESYLSTRASPLRHTWKRKLALLVRTRAVRWQFYQMGDDPGPLIALYENVRRRSWKEPEPFPEFIGNLICVAAAAGALRMGVLFIDEVPAAAQFWIVWGGRATIYKLLYAEHFARFSPGTLLTMEMMRCVLEQDKPSEIDFGRGDDSYKRLWLSSRSERWGIEAANPLMLKGLPRSFRIVAGMVHSSIKTKVFRRGAPSGSRR